MVYLPRPSPYPGLSFKSSSSDPPGLVSASDWVRLCVSQLLRSTCICLRCEVVGSRGSGAWGPLGTKNTEQIAGWGVQKTNKSILQQKTRNKQDAQVPSRRTRKNRKWHLNQSCHDWSSNYSWTHWDVIIELKDNWLWVQKTLVNHCPTWCSYLHVCNMKIAPCVMWAPLRLTRWQGWNAQESE